MVLPLSPANHSPPIGLVAGWGRYPLVVAEMLRAQGRRVCCLGIHGHADPELAQVCDDFAWVGLARLGKVVRHFRQHQVRQLTLAGKIHKRLLFQRHLWWQLLPDWRTIRRFAAHFLTGSKDRQDDTLLMAIVDDFAQAGLECLPATDLVPELLVKLGTLTRRRASAQERSDIEFGWQVAKTMGRLDIGQSVAIKGRVAIAVEAVEGTDECIRRAGQLCQAGGFTVVKVAKPQQDMRFDVPTIGMGTLQTMVQAGARCLAIEADKTIFVDREAALRYADSHGLAIVAIDSAAGLLSEEHDAAAA